MPRGRPPGIKETKPRRPRNGIVAQPRVKSLRQAPSKIARKELACWVPQDAAEQVKALAAIAGKTVSGWVSGVVLKHLAGFAFK
jgi:hypothetical protein